MRSTVLWTVLLAALTPLTGFGQRWEVGAAGGGSFYKSQKVTSSAGSADAGFAAGFAGAAWLGHDLYRYVGGEVRYEYLRNELELSGSGGKTSLGADAHAIHYDLVVHAKPAGERVRPYASVGAGVKSYRGTGSEGVAQPLANIALLTNATDVRALLSVGGGVKWTLSDGVQLRAEFRDLMTPIPTGLIVPGALGKTQGWFHNFVVLVGVSVGN